MSGELRAKLEKWAVDLGHDTSKATEDFSDGNYVHYGALEMLDLLWPVIDAAVKVRAVSKQYAINGMDVFALGCGKQFDEALAKLEKELG